MLWQCPLCPVTYNTLAQTRQHLLAAHPLNHRRAQGVGVRQGIHRVCVDCAAVFPNHASFAAHRRSTGHYGGQGRLSCSFCQHRFASEAALREHNDRVHFRDYQLTRSAFNGALDELHRAFHDAPMLTTPAEVFAVEELALHRLLRDYLQRKRAIRFHVTLNGQFLRLGADGEVSSRINMVLRSRNHNLFIHTVGQLPGTLGQVQAECEDAVEKIVASGSNLVLEKITAISVFVMQYRVAGGAPASTVKAAMKFYAVVPKRCRSMIIDARTDIADSCFYAAVAQAFQSAIQIGEQPLSGNQQPAFFFPDDGTERTRHTLAWTKKLLGSSSRSTGTSFPRPVELRHIDRFEQQSHFDVAVNVFVISEEGQLVPLHHSNRLKSFVAQGKKDAPRPVVANLLLLQHPVKSGLQHYVYIYNIAKFYAGMDNATDYKKARRFICTNCLCAYTKPSALERHMERCLHLKTQRVLLPPPGTLMRFDNHKKQLLCPLVGFCDFEASMRHPDDPQLEADMCALSDSELEHRPRTGDGDTVKVNVHKPNTFALLFISSSDHRVLWQRVESSDDDLLLRFLTALEDAQRDLRPLLSDHAYRMPNLSATQAAEHESATVCYLCGAAFSAEDPKVLDHSHSSLDPGFKGSAHRTCNLKRREQREIPIFLHNGSKYDFHFIIEAVAQHPDLTRLKGLSGLPYNTERFRMLRFSGYKFMDSLQFLPASLATLVDNLRADAQHSYPFLDQFHFRSRNYGGPRYREHLFSKGLYPYEKAVSIQQLRQQIEFFPQRDFYSRLRDEGVTDEDYARAKAMYAVFECENFAVYTQLYCLLDVYLLCEVFSRFRHDIINEFQLDVAQYLSSYQMSWDVFLKETGVALELISDPEMLDMIEGNIRGGLSYVARRHVKMPPNYEPAVNKEFLLFLDCVNLYGYCMMQMLPLCGFRFLSSSEASAMDFTTVDTEGSLGYFVECDLITPDSEHDRQDSLPLLSTRYQAEAEVLSPYSSSFQVRGGRTPAYGPKLTGTFLNKERVTVHSAVLKFLLRNGLQCTKVHRVIEFQQARFMQQHVSRMTRKRMNARTKFEKDNFKLLINALYGKSIQSVRGYLRARFVTNKKQFWRVLRDPAVQSCQIVSDNLVIVFQEEKTVCMNRPYALGMGILERSKLHMSTAWSDIIQPRLGGPRQCEVIMSDTDSLLIYGHGHCSKTQALHQLKDIMDFSNYPKNHPLFDVARAQVPGFFKDEVSGNDIMEAVCLRSKSYGFTMRKWNDRKQQQTTQAKCKGILKHRVRKFTIDRYLACLNSAQSDSEPQYRIQGRKYKLHLIHQVKRALSAFDDKRYWMCKLHSVPFGSYRIAQFEANRLQCYKCIEEREPPSN